MTKNFHILHQENYANNRPVSTQEKLPRVDGFFFFREQAAMPDFKLIKPHSNKLWITHCWALQLRLDHSSK
jgi:hypothetical protein